jgi:hypothetical protein
VNCQNFYDAHCKGSTGGCTVWNVELSSMFNFCIGSAKNGAKWWPFSFSLLITQTNGYGNMIRRHWTPVNVFFINKHTGDIFNLNFDVTNVIFFYRERASDRVPNVSFNVHRIVICKHIVLIFSLYVKDMFQYLPFVKSCTQIKKCEQ